MLTWSSAKCARNQSYLSTTIGSRCDVTGCHQNALRTYDDGSTAISFTTGVSTMGQYYVEKVSGSLPKLPVASQVIYGEPGCLDASAAYT